MLITGPTEWSETLLATGVKANLLHYGYNPTLQVSAVSLGPAVTITRYEDVEATPTFARGILDQRADTLVLHGNDLNPAAASTPPYRLVSWSQGSKEKCLLAIASISHVEIWEVTVARDISAFLRGSVNISHAQGLTWNPQSDFLLIVSKTDVQLISVLQSTLSRRTIYTDSSSRYAFGACSWSPCGLHLSFAQHHVLQCFSWTNLDAVLTELPKISQIDASSSVIGINKPLLGVGAASRGPIAAIARISPTICILTTDTQVILEDISRGQSEIKSLNSEIRKKLEAEITSTLLVDSDNTQTSNIREKIEGSSSGIIDLMSMRVSSSSACNSLQILNCNEDAKPQQNSQREKPRSHLLVLEYKVGQWGIVSTLKMPHLTSPDVLIVQDMRVIVGSSLSPHLLVAHLDVSNSMEWTISLSGELELPPTHVCRGIYLAERSPFIDVASTEKRKHATFFHTAANLEPQPVFLSKFKVPRRMRPLSSVKPAQAAQETTAIADQTLKSSTDSSETKDLLGLIMMKMTAMQTQLNTRFDSVDEKLLLLTARVDQMERNSGTCAK